MTSEKGGKKKPGKVKAPPAPRTKADELREDSVDHQYGRQKVMARGHRFRGLNDWQKTAIRKFLMDWELAYERGMAGGAWKPKVDVSSRDHGVHIQRLEAQDRLRRLERAVGKRAYEIAVAYAVDQIGPDAISKKGGLHKSSVGDQIRAAVDSVAVFYGIRSAKSRDKLMEAIDAIRIDRERIELGDQMVKAAERDLAVGRQQTSAGMSGEESRQRKRVIA